MTEAYIDAQRRRRGSHSEQSQGELTEKDKSKTYHDEAMGSWVASIIAELPNCSAAHVITGLHVVIVMMMKRITRLSGMA